MIKRHIMLLLLPLVAISCSMLGGNGEPLKVFISSGKTSFNMGEKILINLKTSQKIDSISVEIDGENSGFTLKNGVIEVENSALSCGDNSYRVTAYKGGKHISKSGDLTIFPSVPPKYSTLKVAKTLNRGRESYTQGYEFYNGYLYESSGLYDFSFLRILEFPSLREVKKIEIDKKYFAEGITILNDKLYMLTWRENKCFVYDAKTLTLAKTFSYSTEGWGLTNDGEFLYMSDGSEKIYKIDPVDFKIISTLQVTTPQGYISYLNELEWIDNTIWANVYGSNTIVQINPKNGVVETIINGDNILEDALYHDDTDVFNGIAQDEESGKIYVTGKLWPRIFEVTAE